MGKSTISMAIFNSFLYVYQRVCWLQSHSYSHPQVHGIDRDSVADGTPIPTIFPYGIGGSSQGLPINSTSVTK